MESSRPRTSQCPVSESSEVRVFVEVDDMPVLCNALYESRDAALNVARGDLELGYVQASGHIYNLAFDPDKITYSQAYENSLHHSPRFQQYATALAARLIDTYDVRGQTVVDIGCGQGDFLELLCERGDNVGIGYDPSFDPAQASDPEDRPFTVVQDVYSESYADHPADFICCRHVLEHIADPLSFARTVRRAIGDRSDAVVYFEVPNAMFTLRDVAIWDLIYEHCSYFTPTSLAYLFRRAGFEVLRVGEAFDGQYLQIELRPGEPEPRPVLEGDLETATVTDAVDRFVDRDREKRSRWRETFAQAHADDQRVVIWGAGSKGITLLNAIPEAARAVEYVVDINPKKQGKYVSGTGQKIVPPSFLRKNRPDRVIIMNGIYEEEIRQSLHGLGVDAEVDVAT